MKKREGAGQLDTKHELNETENVTVENIENSGSRLAFIRLTELALDAMRDSDIVAQPPQFDFVEKEDGTVDITVNCKTIKRGLIIT